jgi:phosphatidylinositol 3-kinase
MIRDCGMPVHRHRELLYQIDWHQANGYRGRSDLYITCQLWADGKDYTLPTRTPWKGFTSQYK